MENPTLEQMEAWRDQATERLSLFSRSNAIEEPIGIGEECYQLGEDCYKPDRYDQFRWVTEDQFDSVLPPGIEHDRYIAMTNMTGFDDEIKEWSANWNTPDTGMMPRPMPYGPATTAPIGPPATKTRRTPS